MIAKIISEKLLKNIAWGLLAFGALASIILIVRALCNGLNIGGNLDMAATGQIGDFIGGVVGTIISAAGFIFLYLTLNSQNAAIDYQKEAFEKEKIESRFFELLQLHRANVSELSFRHSENGDELSSGRKVFKDIYYQLTYAIRLITYSIKDLENKDILISQSFIDGYSNDGEIQRQLIISNLAYSLVFFGIANESYEALNNFLLKDFKTVFVNRLIEFVSLIPNKESKYWKDWESFYSNITFGSNIKGHFDGPPAEEDVHQVYNLKPLKDLIASKKFFKYFGGHQAKLGHYYRHMFITTKYIDSKALSFADKEEYIRILRAQLSNYEQFLLFFNSICAIGREWELNYKATQYKWLITKFNLIRNVPYTKIKYVIGNQNHLIDLKNFYPLVNYEVESKPIKRVDYIAEIIKKDNEIINVNI